MEGLSLTILRAILMVLASLGIVFHLLVLRSPERGKKLEQKLGSEFGNKKRFVPWLEQNRMRLHEGLIESKGYNVIAVIFLIILLILLVQS